GGGLSGGLSGPLRRHLLRPPPVRKAVHPQRYEPSSSSATHDLLDALENTDSVEACCQRWMDCHQQFPGFDDVQHPGSELRIEILNDFCSQLAARSGDSSLEQRVSELEQCLADRLHLRPHLGWPTTRLFRYLGLDPELVHPLYVLSRMPGWSAHIMEQSESNCPIHPEANYIGPNERDFTELSRRS
ncbi:MAG: citrate/2-methylcitrate synthase, partial [Planctomycetaceae bacterium]